MQAAAEEGQKVADKLRAAGKEQDALEVERLVKVCVDVADGKVSGAELDKAIDDVKAEIDKLKADGMPDEAKELEVMQEMYHLR